MPKALYNKSTGQLVMQLTDEQLGDLVNLLEEENANDRDYYIDDTVVAFLEEKGADRDLVASLRRALGARGGQDETFSSGSTHPEEGIEVVWREE
jgi:hypothetical protein